MNCMKLYYQNCHLYNFSAKVASCEKNEEGYLVTLDATAFYPEGGGQACDLGTLGGARVLDVQEQGDAIFHLCDKPLAVGTVIEGHIDSDRRLDLMQQHSGEHIVSGIICKMFSCHNVGFHVGKDTMEIDFDAPIPAEMLPQIELLANEAIWKNLPIRCYYPTAEELPTIPYRSKKALDWPVRIVEISGYDICACCGVHVEKTGEIGLIKLLSCVKLRGGIRIEMVCGKRAFLLAQEIFAQNQLVSQVFSAKPKETGAAAQRMNESVAYWKLQANVLQAKIFAHTAERYRNEKNVVHFEENLSANQLRELTEAIKKSCSGWAAALTFAENGYNICILGEDLTALTTTLKENFRTRGGGKSGTFQGTIFGSKDEIIDFLRQAP